METEPMSALEVLQDVTDGGTTVRLSGELDISTAAALERVLAELQAPDGPARIVMDLSGLRFMDSTGLRLLVTADLRLRGQGRELALVPGPESVHRVFRLALLEERLTFVDGSPHGSDA
jgi:anti-sigma B factor antagonist